MIKSRINIIEGNKNREKSFDAFSIEIKIILIIIIIISIIII